MFELMAQPGFDFITKRGVYTPTRGVSKKHIKVPAYYAHGCLTLTRRRTRMNEISFRVTLSN